MTRLSVAPPSPAMDLIPQWSSPYSEFLIAYLKSQAEGFIFCMDGFSSCRGNCLCCLFHLPSPEGQEICVFHLLGIDLLLSAEEVFPCGLRSFRGDQIAVSELETDAIRSLNAWMGVEGEEAAGGSWGCWGGWEWGVLSQPQFPLVPVLSHQVFITHPVALLLGCSFLKAGNRKSSLNWISVGDTRDQRPSEGSDKLWLEEPVVGKEWWSGRHTHGGGVGGWWGMPFICIKYSHKKGVGEQPGGTVGILSCSPSLLCSLPRF